ncbi:diguanylate cyclase [Actinoplanes sp. NPDC004185]
MGATPSPPAEPALLQLEPGDAAGLEVLGELGRGSQAVVHRVRLRGQEYALRLLRDTIAASTEGVREFRRQCALLAAVDSPGLPRVHKAGTAGGRPYVIMDLLPGEPLTARLTRGPVRESVAVRIGTDIAGALAAAHAHDLVHRDVKPDNIVVGPDGGAGLVDFGLATRVSAGAGITEEAVAGTLLYSPPEQSGMLNRPVDGRSDLYALGAVLFECVTGAPPFAAGDVGELLHLHATAPVPDPRALAPGLGAAFAAIIVRLLAKDPDDRYQSAAGLLADLRRLGDDPAAMFPLGEQDGPVTLFVAPLTGRDAEFSSLRERWSAAAAGRGGLAVLHGSTGSGKTRLAVELAELVVAAGGTVLRGTASPSDRRPMAPLRAAVDAYVRALLRRPGGAAAAGKLLRSAAGQGAGLVTSLSPALADALGVPGVAAEIGLERHSAAVADLLTGLARTTGPVLLHLDDVQWFDDGTVRVLEQLAAGLTGVPLLVVATARNDDEGAPAAAMILNRLQPGPDTDITLAPLSAAAVGDLISSLSGGVRIDERGATAIAVLTGGNPFATLGYARAVIDAGLLTPDWGVWQVDTAGVQELALPADSAQLLLRRMGTLAPENRRLLQLAGVIGATFAPGLVAEVAGVGRRRVLDVLSDAARRGLVEQREGSVRFLHDSIRLALIDGLPEDEERRLHQRIADVLDREGADVYALARHCALGDPSYEPARMLRAGQAAGARALAEHAPDTALTFLEYAAEAAGTGGLTVGSEFHQLLGIAYHQNGRFDEAIAALTTALDGTTDRTARAHLHLHLARVHESNWGGAAQLREVELGLAELGRPLPRNPVLAALTGLWLFFVGCLIGVTRLGYGTAKGAYRERLRLQTTLYHYGGSGSVRTLRPLRSLLYGLRFIHPTSRLGRSPERARDLVGLTLVLRMLGLQRISDRITAAAVRQAHEFGDPTLLARIDWMTAIAVHGSGADSGERVRQVLAERDRFLDVGLILDCYAVLGWDWLLRGEITEAEAARPGRQRWLEAGGNADRSAVVAVDAGLLAMRGRAGEAITTLARAGDGPKEIHEVVDTIIARMLSAVERDDLEGAFDDAVADFESLGLRPLDVLPAQHCYYVYLAYGRLEQARRAAPGDRDTAVAVAAAAVSALGRVTRRPIVAAHHRIARAALLALDPARSVAVLDLLAKAEPLLRQVDAPLPAFEAALVRARALAATGSTGEAERQARMAAGIAEDRGWPHRARRVAAEFRLDAGRRNRVPVVAARGRAGQRWAALEQLSLAASRVIDPDRLTRVALDETTRLLGAERAILFLMDAETQVLAPYVGRDSSGRDVTELTGYSATVVDKVRHSREPLVVTGTEQGEALGAQSVVQYGLRSILVAPLELDDRLLGVVYLDSRVAKGVFTVDDADVLTAITHHIAVGLETARAAQLEVAVAAANRQRDLAETLRRAMARLTGTLDPQLVLRRLLLTARQTPGANRGWLLLGTSDSEEITVLGGPAPVQLALAEHPDLRALLDNRQADMINGTPPWAGAFDDSTGQSWLTVTLDDRNGALGVLVLASDRPGAYAAADLGLAAALVGQGMVAFDNARLFSRVNELATTDSLTGVANRRRFFELAERSLAAARAVDGPVTALMVDIDHFKRINDAHGHQVGDDVIKGVVQRLLGGLPADGLVARYGGEEFAVLLPGIDSAGAKLAEELRAAVAGTPVDTRSGPIPVTISVGLARLRPSDPTPDTLLGRADAGLYAAKQAGRNRVVAHDPEHLPL